MVLPAAVAAELGLPEAIALATDAGEGYIGCGPDAPLLDGLTASVRAPAPVTSVAWQAEPPKLASATYVAGGFAWAAEADVRYEGLTFVAAHAGTTSEPDGEVMAAITRLITGHDPRVIDEREARGATGAATVIARRAGEAIGPRLEEVGVAVARRRDRERGRIDEYLRSLVDEAQRPRRQVAREAIEARVAALRAEHASKLRDLASRYTLRVRLEPVALVAFAVPVTSVQQPPTQRSSWSCSRENTSNFTSFSFSWLQVTIPAAASVVEDRRQIARADSAVGPTIKRWSPHRCTALAQVLGSPIGMSSPPWTRATRRRLS